MRPLLLAIVIAGCGQMYRKPGDTKSPPAEPTQPGDPQALPASEPQGQPAAQPTMQQNAARAGQPDAPVPAAKTGTTPNAIAQRFVDAHNHVRALHCAKPLTWSPKLADVAQKWANALRDKGCAFGHSGGQYGENLAAGTEGVLDPEATVKMWYDEIEKYKFPDGGFSMQTGHFTQVVWRGTTQVGCGHASCKGNDIWVCNYDPAGNWEGQYRENVLATGCK
jgi:uncharacterized protein YkwD